MSNNAPSSRAAEVHLVAPAGPGYGSGHAVRMRELARRLRATGVGCVIHPDLSAATRARPALWILDARDCDPLPFIESAPVLAIDNRHPRRAELTERGVHFTDTLPHPADPGDSWRRTMLVSHAVLRAAGAPKGERVLYVYTGAFSEVPGLAALLTHLSARGWEIERVVTGSKTRAQAARALAAATHVLTYFGMTLFEGWYLGGVPLLLDVESAVHRELAADLRRRAGVEILVPTRLAEAEALLASARRPERGPTGAGYDVLVDRVRQLLA